MHFPIFSRDISFWTVLINLADPTPLFSDVFRADSFSAAALIYEIFHSSTQPMFSSAKLRQYISGKYKPQNERVPGTLFSVLMKLVNSSLQLSDEEFGLSEALNSGAFPIYFKDVYDFLATFHCFSTPLEQAR